MNVDELSNTYFLGLLTALVGVGAFAFSIFQHFSVARLSQLQAQYEAKQLIRAAQLQVGIEIMDLVGRFVNPENEEQFDRDWYDFSTIYTGRASLIDDDKFKELLTKFGSHFWDNGDLGYEHFGSFEGPAQREFERDALALNSHLNITLLRQFHVNPRSKKKIGSKGHPNE